MYVARDNIVFSRSDWLLIALYRLVGKDINLGVTEVQLTIAAHRECPKYFGIPGFTYLPDRKTVSCLLCYKWGPVKYGFIRRERGRFYMTANGLELVLKLLQFKGKK